MNVVDRKTGNLAAAPEASQPVPVTRYGLLRSIRDKYIGKRSEASIRRTLFPVVRLSEWLVFGGNFRRDSLLWLLYEHYRSRFRRYWLWYSTTPPHFFDLQISFFSLIFGKTPPSPEFSNCGFFGSEIIENGDLILDIGCGDGFFTKRFFSQGAARVDAIDIDPDAIAIASKYNSASNISYSLVDAVRSPFPTPLPSAYDVVIWNGALGHFAPDTTMTMLSKIKSSLRPDGVFCGSESLGREGSDHLQFFETLDDLATFFKKFFTHVFLKSVEYRSDNSGFVRREAYWRCSNDSRRLEKHEWRKL